MKNKIGIFILLLIAVFTACKNGNETTKVIPSKKTIPDTFNIAKKIPVVPPALPKDTSVHSAFDDPIKVANNKYSHFDQILMKDLSKGLFLFDGGIDGFVNLTEKELGGQWIQFFMDGRYEKGEYAKIKTRGKYTVDNLGFIEFLPTDQSDKKSEYQAKFNNDILILIGTNKHMDNRKQYKLSRNFQKPKK